jgi:hypothetical protein
MLEGTGLRTVPVARRGRVKADELQSIIGPSAFDSAFDNPSTGRSDNLMEELYVRTEADGDVRAGNWFTVQLNKEQRPLRCRSLLA